MFFKFTAAITILFGCLDLYLKLSMFFKFEATASNVLVGCFFASTLFSERTLIHEFALQQGRVGDEVSVDTVFYFKLMTLIWALYFWIKAGVYAWFASHYTMEQSLLLRIFVGNVSFYLMVGISSFGAKPILATLRKAKILPSSRVPSCGTKTKENG